MTMKEEWRSVPTFYNYEASTLGVIRNKSTKRILKHSVRTDGSGVPVVSLINNGSLQVLEVRFVIACAFLGVDINCRPKPKLKYKDGNKFNNSVLNIEIVTPDDLLDEVWKSVPSWEGLYEVSNLGRVKRLSRVDEYARKDTGRHVTRLVSELILKQTDSQGYMTVGLTYKNRTEYPFVHRLVAEAFISNPNDLPQVNHIDGNKHNNNVDNLEWVTAKQNVAHANEIGLRSTVKHVDRSKKKVKCQETGQVFNNVKEAAAQLDLSYSYLASCINTNKPCHNLHFIQIKNNNESL